MADHTQSFVLQAKRLFVLRHFKQAINICQEGLGRLKCVRHSSSDRTRAFNQSALVIIAVQAYAEMDLWQEAVTFAVSTFESTEKLPLEVAKVCVSLYTNVQQFSLATELVEDWLSNVDNCSQSRHRNMVEFYIRCVLPHQKDSNKAIEFIENNHVLDEDEKKYMQDIVNTSERESEQKEQTHNMQSAAGSQKEKSMASSSPHSPSTDAVAVHHGFLIRISTILEKLRSLGTQLGSYGKMFQFTRLLFLLFFLFAALTATSSQGFLSKDSGISVLYQAALQAWRAMFAPYHLMSLKNH